MLTIPLFLESRVLVVVVNVQQGIKYLSKYFLPMQNDDVSVTRLHPLAAVIVIIMSELLQQKRKTYIYLL